MLHNDFGVAGLFAAQCRDLAYRVDLPGFHFAHVIAETGDLGSDSAEVFQIGRKGNDNYRIMYIMSSAVL